MSSVWKGSIAFGLVSIPVKISVAARTERVSFNMLHNECHGRTKQKMECPACDKEITKADTVKGYEVAKDRYVIVTEAELEACESATNKVMEIAEMVRAEDVDPILLDASYFLEPELAGHKGYKLLHDALVAESRFAIARLTMSGREHVAVIRPYRGVLTFSTMFMADEIRQMPAADLSRVELKPAELELARRLVQVHAAQFDHARYHDGYRLAVAALIEAKASGEPIIPAAAPKRRDEVVDIMAASAPPPAPAPVPVAPQSAAPARPRRVAKKAVA